MNGIEIGDCYQCSILNDFVIVVAITAHDVFVYKSSMNTVESYDIDSFKHYSKKSQNEEV